MAVILKYENGTMIPVQVNSVYDYVPTKSKNKAMKLSKSFLSILVMLSITLSMVSALALILGM